MIDFEYIKDRMTLEDFDVREKTVLMRVDYNVPLDSHGQVADSIRIKESLPTLSYLLKNGARVVLISHFKKPQGWDVRASLRQVLPALEKELGEGVHFFTDSIFSNELREKIQRTGYGEVILLENIRFYPEETQNNRDFARQLAGLGDIFINDAFGTMHRAHASTVGIPEFLPSGLGFLPMKEIQFIQDLISQSKPPFVVILGGGKISSKLAVLEGLLTYADHVLIGGGMSFTFLKLQGYSIGNSFFEPSLLDKAKELLRKYKKKILLPTDVVVAEKIQEGIPTHTVKMSEGIPENQMGLDIGPETCRQYDSVIQKAQSIFWNGPMGVFEVPPLDKGTKAVAHSLEKAMQYPGVITLVGGGESAMAVKLYGVADKMSHVSTGGGALLELLENTPLPGIMAISQHSAS